MGAVEKRKPGRPMKRVPETHKQRFLELIYNGGRIHQSAYQAGHDPRTFWRIMDADPEFKAEFERAKEIGGYAIIDELERRGVDGWDEEVFGKDGPIGVVRKYDSNLGMFVAKGRLPQYKDNPKIDLSQTHVSVSYEDRSASVADMWRVLADAGVNAGEVAVHGRRVVGELLPPIEGVLAKPSNV